MILTKYLYDNPPDYSFVDSEIMVDKACLSIVDKTGLSFNEDFANDTGFTYDNALTEFVAGQMQQKNQTPAGVTFLAQYDTTIDADFSSGTATGTAAGGAAIAAGKLDLKGNTIKHVSYDGTDGNVDWISAGAIRMIFTPNFTGFSTSTKAFFSYGQGTNNNLLRMYFLNNGRITMQMYDSSGTLIIQHGFNNVTKSWTAGQDYEIELNFDPGGGGDIRLFIDGVQHGTTGNGTGTRTNAGSELRIGGDVRDNGMTQDAEFSDVQVFDAVQHTADYTPSPIAFGFDEDTITLPNFTYTGLGDIQSIQSLVTTQGGAPRFIIEGMYWNGSAWAASDDSYAQANDLATVNTNIAALDVSGETEITIKVVFPTGMVQASVDDLTVNYTGQKYPAEGSVTTLNLMKSKTYSLFDSEEETPASTSVKYSLIASGQEYYWDGAAWVIGNGTSAEANTKAEMIANIAAFFPNTNLEVAAKVYLVTTDELVTPCIKTTCFTYSFGAQAPTDAERSSCYMFVTDIEGQPIAGAKVKISPSIDSSAYKEAAGRIVDGAVEKTTDVEGYVNFNLIRSSEFEGANFRYVFTVEFPNGDFMEVNGSSLIEFTVPDQEETNITDQVLMPDQAS